MKEGSVEWVPTPRFLPEAATHDATVLGAHIEPHIVL